MPQPVNDEGAPVALGNDKFGPIGHIYYGGCKFYCGRNEKVAGKIRGSDGDCGVSGGPQCNSCSRFQASLYNDEGVRVRLGNDTYGAPGTRNYGGNKWYCGRSMNIPGTDGQCGPSGGNQCPSCTRFQKDPAGTMAKMQAQAKAAPPPPKPAPPPPAPKPKPASTSEPPIKAKNGWSSFISYKQVSACEQNRNVGSKRMAGASTIGRSRLSPLQILLAKWLRSLLRTG